MTTILRLGLLGCLCATGCAYDTTGMTWTNGDVTLQGTLYTPKGSGPFPAAVFIGGSGDARRTRMAKDHAKHLARGGIATLIYDKRGCGDSSGDWKEADLNDLADDVVAVIAQLSARPNIDSQRIGVIGISQGAWVTLLAAGRCPAISYMVNLSGGAVKPVDQGQWVLTSRMRRAGHSEEHVAAALAADTRILKVWREDDGWEELEELRASLTPEPWFADARLAFQTREYWNWKWYSRIMDYDPLPAVAALPVPMLFILSDSDPLIPTTAVEEAIARLAPQAPAARDVVVLANLRHDLRRAKGAAWPQEYWSALDGWLRRQGIMRP